MMKGFVLIELVITLLVVGILLAIALPAYQQQLIGMRRAMAVLEVNDLQLKQEAFYLENRRYAIALAELGKPQDEYALDGDGSLVSIATRTGVYRITLTAGETSFAVHAAPLSGQRRDTACGTLSLNHLGVQANSGSGHAWECW